jgi:hypothetical protein
MKHNSNTVHRPSSIVKKNNHSDYNDQSLNRKSINAVAENEKEVLTQASRILSADRNYIKTKADEDRPE